MSGRVIVAGAGCGDYDLITMRGYEALKSCDVVIYDSLIDSRLLDFCKDGAERICVGKRAGRHSSCLLYTSPSPRDLSTSRMPSSA